MATKTSPRKGVRSSSGGAGSGPGNVAKSHKSFQPILPCGNKLLQQKWDQTYYEQHRKLVASAKPMVDSKAPPVRPHVTTKLKKQQLEKERFEEIDRDNMTLLRKMQHIMKTEGCVDHRNMYQHHSLNEEHRRREMTRVAKENKSMLKRLEDAKPMYRISDMVTDWQRKEGLTNMITSYPVTPGSIPLATKITGKDDSAVSPESTVATKKSDSVARDTHTTPRDTKPKEKCVTVQDKDPTAKVRDVAPQDTHNVAQDTVEEDITAQDEQIPPQDTDTTAEDKDTSIQDTNTPAQDTDTTAEDKDTSVQDTNTPAQDTDTSVQDEQTPIITETDATPQDMTTTQDEHTPVQDTNTTVQDSQIPLEDTDTAAQNDTTAQDEHQDTQVSVQDSDTTTTAQDTHQDGHTTTSDTDHQDTTSQGAPQDSGDS